jgi:hypothetical protein
MYTTIYENNKTSKLELSVRFNLNIDQIVEREKIPKFKMDDEGAQEINF